LKASGLHNARLKIDLLALTPPDPWSTVVMGIRKKNRAAITVSTTAPHSQDDSLTKERHILRMLEAANIIPWEADFKTWRFTYVGP